MHTKMNKKGLIFATFTVMIVFLFIISHIIYKMHAENKSKLKDVGLGTVDLMRQRGDFEFDNLVSEKDIELKVNDALVKFANSEGKNYLKDERFNDMFFQYLKKDNNFLDYDFNLVENIIEFSLKKTGTGKISDVNDCKKKVVELAEKQIGCKYVLGAKGPCGSAFDCSGLIKWVYVNACVGVNYFPDGSWIQADWGRRKNLGVGEIGRDAKLETDKLELGDIVFFKGSLPTDGYGAEELDIRHVGMYVGEGKIVEAKGKDYGVVESNINEKVNYRGAIRVCSGNFVENEGVFSSDFKYNYKIELTKRDFITSEGIKSINI